MCDSNKEKATFNFQETAFGGSVKSQRKKVIYFSSGETLEDSDEEEEEEEDESSARRAFREPTEKAKSLWRNAVVLVGRTSLRSCDFLGEKLAGLLGLNAAKYQYAIDEYHRDNKVTADDDSKAAHKGHCESVAESTQISTTRHGIIEYGATTSDVALPGFVTSNDMNSGNGNQGAHNKGYEPDNEE